MSALRRLSYQAWFSLAGVALPIARAAAQFGGEIPPIDGTPEPGIDVRDTILRVLGYILSFLALIAVIYIIIAGIRLIVSQGEEEQKEKAKKTILYVIFGLIVILLARIIVAFFTETVPQELS